MIPGRLFTLHPTPTQEGRLEEKRRWAVLSEGLERGERAASGRLLQPANGDQIRVAYLAHVRCLQGYREVVGEHRRAYPTRCGAGKAGEGGRLSAP